MNKQNRFYNIKAIVETFIDHLRIQGVKGSGVPVKRETIGSSG